jgi:acyl carrier protein
MAKQLLTLLAVCLSVWLTGCGSPEPPPASKPIQQCKDEKTLNEVRGILSSALHFPIEDLKPDMRLTEDLGIGGPARIQIRMDLEQSLGIKIFEEEIKKARTVTELAAFVDEKVKKLK